MLQISVHDVYVRQKVGDLQVLKAGAETIPHAPAAHLLRDRDGEL
jgi:hypothetical protein